MHIPENFISPSTCAVMGAAMIPVWTAAVKKVKKEVSKEKLPLIGIGAAFSFIIMMFNVPLPGGSTGHAVGGTLLAILLGPWSACISVTTALLIQALMFGDGGVLAFGANCFNMAFVLPFTGYFIYKFIRNSIKSDKGEYFGIILGSYIGLNFAALFTAIEFGIQPLLFKGSAGLPLYFPYDVSVTLPAMLIPHLLVAGIVEAAFTIAVYMFVKKVSPGTIYEGKQAKFKPLYSIIIGLICLAPIGLLASGTAWGEWGIDEIKNVISGGKALGFVPEGIKNGFSFESIMPDYSVNGFSEIAGYILAACAGVAVLIIIFKIAGFIKKERAEDVA